MVSRQPRLHRTRSRRHRHHSPRTGPKLKSPRHSRRSARAETSTSRGLRRRLGSRSRARARGVGGARAAVTRSRSRSHRRGATNATHGVALAGGGGARRSPAAAPAGHVPSFGTLAAYGLGATAVALGAAAAYTSYNKRKGSAEVPVLENVAAVKRARDALARAAKQGTGGPATADLAAVQGATDAAAAAAVAATRAAETLHRVSAENDRVHTPASAAALKTAVTQFNAAEAAAERAAADAVKNVESAKARGGWSKKTLAALVLVAGAVTGLVFALSRHTTSQHVEQLYEPLHHDTHSQPAVKLDELNEGTCNANLKFTYKGKQFEVTNNIDPEQTFDFRSPIYNSPRLVMVDDAKREEIENSYEFIAWKSKHENCLQPSFKDPEREFNYDIKKLAFDTSQGPRGSAYKTFGIDSNGLIYGVRKSDNSVDQFSKKVQQALKSTGDINFNNPGESWDILDQIHNAILSIRAKNLL